IWECKNRSERQLVPFWKIHRRTFQRCRFYRGCSNRKIPSGEVTDCLSVCWRAKLPHILLPSGRFTSGRKATTRADTAIRLLLSHT
ncbi:hypothetical protein TELCIR_23116, partial [Teladorsagia circumcincta]